MTYEIKLLSGEVHKLKMPEDFKTISLNVDSDCYEFYDDKFCMIACFPLYHLAYFRVVKGEKE